MSPESRHQRTVGWESVRNASLAGLGLIAAIGVAEISSAPRAMADPSPLESSSDLKEECVKAGLVMPQFTTLKMVNAGKRAGPGTGLRKQDIVVRANYRPMPGVCDKFMMVGQVKFQIQDSEDDYSWKYMDTSWQSIQFSDDGEKGQYDEVPIGHEEDSYYQNKREKVRMFYQQKVVGKKKIKVPVKGHPGLYKTKRPVYGRKSTVKKVPVRKGPN